MNFPFNRPITALIGDESRCRLGIERWLDEASATEDCALSMFMRKAVDDNAPSRPLLSAAFANSPFLTHCLLREPAFARLLFEDGPDQALADLHSTLAGQVTDETDQAVVMASLRVAKRRLALLAGLADIGGVWGLSQVTGALTGFAETAIRHALGFLLRREARRGEIRLANPDDPECGSGVLVLGMGKLGAFELNYSSDIDIIVFYDGDKIAYVGQRSLSECMIGLTRDLVKILDERTGDGYVFRTDLRLRPDPGSTPVAISIAAAEIYYEGFGQNWERAAMIKARQVAGDAATGQAFLKFLRPFIWRKSLDFAAIQDIHSIKRQINAHKGGHAIAVAGHNIKLGRGGIREIEFFAQTQQLIWGGRQPEMRSPATLDALAALAEAGHVEAGVAAELNEAYHYLRTLEHRLQMVDDKQTQTLPSDPLRLGEIARFMGHPDVETFSQALTRRLQVVERHYARLFEDAPELGDQGNLVFTGGENDPETVATITEMGFGSADAICSTIRGWHHGRVRATRSTRAREMLTELTPTLLRALAGTSSPDDAFMRFDEFVSRLPAGVPLFSLFTANPSLLDLVAEIMGDAPRLAAHLSRHSNLLDAVLQANFFDPPPPALELGLELDRALAEADSYEEGLDLARRWANDRKFQIGVQLLRTLIDTDRAARAFTAIADCVLAGLAPLVEAEMARVHGRVAGGRWCLLAMGKAGGREMTATSDLDLILIYDVPEGVDESDGGRPMAAASWYARFTQRLVNALSAKTAEGALYEVDMRLRPSGNAGPIATSLTAFTRYQAEAAWTWEHMALTRARVVIGDQSLAISVAELIKDTLTRPRDPTRLATDVAEMRERMAKEHRAESAWEVKHRRGGLVDIEFTAQFLQLRHGADHPDILAENTRDALERACRAGVLDRADCDALVEAWMLWSAVQTVLRQTIEGRFDEAKASAGLKSILVRAAGLTDFKTLADRMEDCARAALDTFQRILTP